MSRRNEWGQVVIGAIPFRHSKCGANRGTSDLFTRLACLSKVASGRRTPSIKLREVKHLIRQHTLWSINAVDHDW